MQMIKTLTAKNIKSMIWLLLFLWGVGGACLWHYGPDTLRLLQGRTRPEFLEENVSNYYGMSAIALLLILLGLAVLIRQLTFPLKKRVNQYLEAHPEVTLKILDNDFAKAEEFGAIWVGKQFTYAADLKRVLLENDRIVWVYKEVTTRKNASTYHIHWCMADGQEYSAQISAKNLDELMDHYGSFPHIIISYSQDYHNMFKHNLNQLLDIRYNQYIKK